MRDCIPYERIGYREVGTILAGVRIQIPQGSALLDAQPKVERIKEDRVVYRMTPGHGRGFPLWFRRKL